MNILKRNQFLLITLFPLVITFLLYIICPNFIRNLWEILDEKNIDLFTGKSFRNINKELLFLIASIYSAIVYFYWVYKNRDEIFGKKKLFRSIIIFLSGFLVAFWMYSGTIASLICYLVLVLVLVYGVKNKTYLKPQLPIILMLIYVLFQFISLLWLPNNIDIKIIHKLLIQVLPIVLFFAVCLFHLTGKEVSVFISLGFKMLLLILLWSFISYFLAMTYYGENLLSCFTFNKKYMISSSYYSFLQITIFRHPSFLSWVFLIVGGTAYATWKKHFEIINIKELILYWLLMLVFVFMIQSRLGQLGYFITLGFILFFEIVQRVSKKAIILMVVFSIVLFILGVYGLINYTSFFADTARTRMFSLAFEYIKDNPIFGSGMLIERELLSILGYKYDHLHNDFLMALLREGVVGLLLLISWVVLMFWHSIKTKDLRLFFFMLPTFLIMETDSALYHQKYVAITNIFILMTYNYSKE